jgi:lactoylglutathione lyase
MIHVHELNHVLLNVRDLARSIHFYGSIVGLSRLPRPAFDFPGAWFSVGLQELHLIGDPELEPASRHHHHFAMRVDDPTAVRAELETKGVTELRGPSPRPDGAMQLFVLDPDGYLVEFFSSPPKR